MKITNIQKIINGNTLTLQGQVIFGNQKPETIYFNVNKKYADFIYEDASPFLASILLPCMKTNEAIEVDGNVSDKLLSHTKNIQSLIKKWKIGLSSTRVVASHHPKDNGKPQFVGCFFSAGVDSFYTYLKNKKKITHFILVHGFDIELANKELFKETTKNISKIAKEAGIELITVETNVKEIIETKLEWDWSHGGALAAVALMLRGGLKQVFISGAVRKNQLFPYGTHPELDVLWATEKLKFIHEGTEHNRLEKITTRVAKSPLALKYLRVCARNEKGVYNCSRCFKCLRTMIDLLCVDVLKKSKTFAKEIDLELVKNMYYNFALKYDSLAEANLELLRKKNLYPELQKAIEESLRRSEKRSIKRQLTDLVAYVDKTYNDRRLYKWIFELNKQNDRKLVFKLLTARGIIK